jgi:hypothetical protein
VAQHKGIERERETQKRTNTERQKFRDVKDAEQPSENTHHHKKMKQNSLAGMRDRV